ncbi:MAG: class I SAM-dependent methyltransferase [Candidatus Hodarchaeota archaeon]
MQRYNYDNASVNYDISRNASSEVVNKLIRLLNLDSNSVILDLGCGTGNYTLALQRFAKNIIGIDLSLGMIGQARAKFSSLRYVCADISYLPFRSELFDGAFSNQVIHHVQEKELFLKETYRVLRQDAFFVIESCSHNQIGTYWFCHYFPNSYEVEIERIPDIDKIITMLENTGFSNIITEICFKDVIVNEIPENYLNKDYRDGISTFGLLSEEDITIGCNKLREDIASGAVKDVIQKFQTKKAIIGGSSIICGQKI